MADEVKKVSTRISLSGEKEYNAALKEAKRNLSLLQSELKKETAELGKNASEQDKLRVKTESLKKQIAEQEKIVRTYEAALKEVKDKYGDNEDAVAKWEIKLNDAKTALANLKNGLSDTDNGIKQTTTDFNTGITATKNFADSLQSVADVGSSVSGAIENAFTGIVSTITSAVTSVWNNVVEIAAKADNWEDLAAFFNTSATNVQRWDKALEGAGDSMSSVNSLITKLKYSTDDDKLVNAFGISGKNYTDDLEFFEALMKAMTEAKGTMDSNTWDNTMADIFGNKKPAELENLLSDWEAIQSGLETFDATKGGYGLTEEEIQDMATLSEQVNTLKASWEALKEMATVRLFGSLAMEITGNVQELLDAFRDYFNAEDDAAREEALNRIKENVRQIFETVGQAIQDGIALIGELAEDFKNSDDPALQTVGNLLEGLKNVLAWFADPQNWDTVKAFFNGLFGIWATSKVLSVLTNMHAFGVNVGNIITKLKGLSGVGTGDSSGGLTSVNVGTPNTNGTTNSTSGLNLSDAGYILGGAAGLYAIVKGFEWAIDRRKNHPEDVLGTDENLAASTGGNSELISAFVEWTKLQNTMSGFDFSTSAEEIDATQARINEIWEQLNGTEGFDALWDSYEAWRQENVMDSNDWTVPEWLEEMLVPADSWDSTDDNESSGNDDNLMGAINGLPANLKTAMGGIKVYMDSTEVGKLVAPTVSQWMYGSLMGR